MSPAPVAVGSLDLPALEFDEPDLELSAVVRLSVKRAFDVLLSLTALLLLSPVLVLIAALIKLSDGGPIFFVQRRVVIEVRGHDVIVSGGEDDRDELIVVIR